MRSLSRPRGSRVRTVTPRLSPLEPRAVPTVFTVTNVGDAGPGSLRQAVSDANDNPGPDAVQFQPGLTGTIVLTTGQIAIADPLTVTGPGSMTSPALIVTTQFPNRIFDAVADTNLVGLALANGNATVEPFAGTGGAVVSRANLTATDCMFSGNKATGGGGAIYHFGPALTLTRCQFTGNGTTALSGRGGAVRASGVVSMQHCEFYGNRTNFLGSGGGAICLTAGSLALDSCGFVGNGTLDLRYGDGGAVLAQAPVTARNCTFANNVARIGGALFLTAGGTLWNCTVTNNRVPTAGGGSEGGGGGIYCFDSLVTLESTIVSGNVAPSYNGPDVLGPVTAKNCCLGTSDGFTTFTDQGDNLPFGTNPQFSVHGTQVFGGLVSTTALLATSPCRDTGSNPSGALYDARGPGFPRVVGSVIDIGAYEVQPPPRVTVQVNDGGVQRSRVTQLLLTFDHPDVPIASNISDSVQLRRASDNSAVTLAFGGTGGGITPTSAAYPFQFKAGPIDNGSLADGKYVLTVFSTQIVDITGQHLDGNGDGVGGDDYVSPAAGPGRIFRLFGDADGDADVDVADFGAFRGAFANGSNLAFDSDGDGDVDAGDFGQFRQRFGSSV